MKLLRTKPWSWIDIGLLKWCATLFGMIIGAYLHDFVKEYVWYFLLAVIVLAIKPAVSYYRE